MKTKKTKEKNKRNYQYFKNQKAATSIEAGENQFLLRRFSGMMTLLLCMVMLATGILYAYQTTASLGVGKQINAVTVEEKQAELPKPSGFADQAADYGKKTIILVPAPVRLVMQGGGYLHYHWDGITGG